MTIHYLDSFSHYATANIGQKWTGVPDLGRGSRAIVAGSGRCLQSALQLSANTIGSGDGPSLHLPYPGLVEGTMGAGYRLAGENFNTPGYIFAIYKNSTMYGGQIAGLGVQSNGALVAIRGAFGSSTAYEYSLQAIQDLAWHHIVWSFFIDPVVGRFIVYVDGDLANPWIDFTGNTGAAGGYTDLSVLRYNSVSGGGTTQQMSDFWWGDAMSDAKGDTRVYARLPNREGPTLQWTPSTGTIHYQLVDENPPNTTDYNFDRTPGNTDLYGFPSIGIASGTVYAVQVVMMLKKTDVGFRSIAPVVNIAGIDYAGTAQAIADGSWLYYMQCWDANDPAGNPWTVPNAVNSYYGLKTIA